MGKEQYAESWGIDYQIPSFLPLLIFHSDWRNDGNFVNEMPWLNDRFK